MKSGKRLAALGILLAAVVITTVSAMRGAGQNAPLDVVILNGRVMDPESDLDAVRNVGIRAGKIVDITEKPLQGKEVIDAKGLVVAPGFIDLHQHGQDAENDDAKAADGVTTSLEMEVGTADVDAWYAALEGKSRINYGVSIGHIPVRMVVIHDPGSFLPSGDAAKRIATDAEISEIKKKLELGLQRGALGVGAGPAYTKAATNWELVEVFKIAARHGACVHIHIRAPSPPVEGSFDGFEEALAAAAVTGASLHIVHLQSTGGPNVTHELELIQSARARGMDVTTECYPYDRGMTSIESALYDNKENEPDGFFASLLWPQTGEYLTRETFLKYRKSGGLVVAPANTMENVRIAVISPLASIASDGHLDGGKGHPRTSGTYAKVLGQYVREEKALDLMTALRKMTLMPAHRLETHAPVFKNKGRLRVGADADITVFDPVTIIDRSTYEKPATPSVGINFVFVNGVAVLKNGKLVYGAFPGKAARAPITQ
jgi:N-acyl-D-aspartate/D-glutamate deacylase